MKVADQIVVITGGAGGIGQALAKRFHAEGARKIVITDIDLARCQEVAKSVGGIAIAADATKEDEVTGVVEKTEKDIGPIGLYCANAGIVTMDADLGNAASAPTSLWERDFKIHVLSHVWAARALVPKMKARGGGYFMITSSAAGLLSQIGSAVYSTTKHAAVGFAESLAITHKDDNIRVSVLCPQAVDTPMYNQGGGRKEGGAAGVDGVITPDYLADVVVDALDKETFLILPHPQVREYMQRKSGDYDRWIGGMAKFRKMLLVKG